MTTTAILPIKEHSERVPDKNFRDFAGKPLYQWVLDTLLSMREIDEVIVSTDCDYKIDAKYHDDYRCWVLPRMAPLCGDDVSMDVIIEDCVIRSKADVYLQTHATNPLISAETFARGLSTYSTEMCDSVFSCNSIQSRLYGQDTEPINHVHGEIIKTQDITPVWQENGAFFIFSAQSFKASGSRVGLMPHIMRTPAFESFDIDWPNDFELAQVIARHFYG